LRGVGAGFEEGLQDEHRGDLVDDVFAADAFRVWRAGVAEGVEMAVGFGGGEALVPEVDGELELIAEGLGEGLRAGGLGALVAGHVEGVADDCFGDGAVLAQDAGDGFQVVAQFGAMQREERLRGVAERVRERETYAALAYVEAENSGDIRHALESIARCAKQGATRIEGRKTGFGRGDPDGLSG
jgi:hypothetical protein